MENLATQVNNGLDIGWVAGGVVFGLDMVERPFEQNVSIETEVHGQAWGAPEEFNRYRGNNLTGRLPAIIISSLKMTGNYLQSYAPLLIHFLLAAALAGVLVLLSSWVGQRRRSRAKMEAYECGMRPTGDARAPFSVKFYLVAMIFILFDVEAIFLYPWAYVFHDLRWFGFVEMLLFILVVLVGYIYLWKKGAMDWNR